MGGVHVCVCPCRALPARALLSASGMCCVADGANSPARSITVGQPGCHPRVDTARCQPQRPKHEVGERGQQQQKPLGGRQAASHTTAHLLACFLGCHRGSTPLHFAAAAKKDALAVCQLLIASGANPGQPDLHGYLPYEQAEQPEVRVLLGGPDQRLFDYAGECAGALAGAAAGADMCCKQTCVLCQHRAPLLLLSPTRAAP